MGSQARARGGRVVLDDYYAGAEGARRVMKELDHLLQHLLDHVEPAETLTCAIQLRVKGGERVSLKKIYRPTLQALSEDGAT